MEVRDSGKTDNAFTLIAELYKAEFRTMCAVAFRLIGDMNLAEVAVQETFIVAMRFPDKIMKSENPVGWLYKTLNFVSKHVIRDRQKMLNRTAELDKIPEDVIARNDEYSEIDAEIMESDDMKLVKAVYIYGYSIKETADYYGITVGACKMRLKRARERLQKKMDDYRYL